jgi:uncharacterized tellurite resistance protein B-like protein
MSLLLSFLLIFGAGVALAYGLSPVISARKRAFSAVSALEALRSDLLVQDEQTRQAVAQAARQLESAVQTERLRNITIETIKSHASGVRLQALRDAGMRTILDLQGVGAQRLSNIRGIGPKSAGSIAAVVEMLTRTSNSLPVQRPSPPFSGERDRTLLQAVYCELSFDSGMTQQKKAIEPLFNDAKEKLLTIRADSTFLAWCLGFGHSTRLARARDTADSLTKNLEENQETVSLKEQVSAFLAESRTLCSRQVTPEVLLAAYREQSELYDWLLSKALGHNNIGPRPERPEQGSSSESVPLSYLPDHAERHAEFSSPVKTEAFTTAPMQQSNFVVGLHPPSAKDPIPIEQIVSAESLTHVEFGRLVAGSPPETQTRTLDPVDIRTSHAKNATEAIQMLNRLQAKRADQKGGETGFADSTVGEKTNLSQPTPDEFIILHVGDQEASAPREFPLPARIAAFPSRDLKWIVPGESITIHGVTISRSFFYFGPTVHHSDRFVIDPLLPAKPGTTEGFEENSFSLSYPALTPRMRFRYLQWLANGAAEGEVPHGFAMIYFQGVERRVLQLLKVGETESSVVIDELLREIRRVEVLFRLTQNTISGYANSLLAFFAARAFIGAPMPALLPDYERTYELPFEFKLGLGCFIKEKQPIPVDWALRWVYLEPTIYLRTAVSRCLKEFEAAFRYLYAKKHVDGLVIKPNKTILSISYQPTWTGGDDSEVRLEFTGVPDVKALTAPQNGLRELVEQVTALIDPYSRLLGPAATKAGKLEALLMLPAPIWPQEAKVRFDFFRASVVQPMSVTSCEAVFTALECQEEVTSSRVTELARNLHRFQIGFEPDVLSGARRPKAADPVVLFPLTEEFEEDRKLASYQTASLCVALAAVLTLADGHASEVEAATLDRTVSTWEGISNDLRSRLRAHYRLCLQQPPTLVSLKARLESLNTDDRKRLASSLSLIAASDGVVSPEEVRLLERLYKMLTLETQELYSDLHGATGSFRTSSATESAMAAGDLNNSFLDHSRISELRLESRQVSDLLAEVFLEEELLTVPPGNEPLAPLVAAPLEIPSIPESALPGLTATDQRFLKLLLSQTEWPRAELLRSAGAMQIMLDGALERINEAALDHLGDFLIDGDDPIYIQQTLLETAE